MKKILNNPLAIMLFMGLVLGSFSSPLVDQLFKHEMQIKGTSSLHDWECEVKEVQVMLDAEYDASGLKTVKDLLVKVPVKSIESGKSLMNKKLYRALKAEKHPYIEFDFLKVVHIENEKVTVIGQLRIAGESKMVEVSAQLGEGKNGYFLQGKCPINMTDFKVEPPVAMMGTLKTGEEIVVEFKTYINQPISGTVYHK